MMRWDYACPDCQEQFEAARPLEERQTAPCPSCGGTAEKTFNPRAVSFLIDHEWFAHTPQDFRLPADPTRNKTANYLEGELLARHHDEMHAATEQNRKKQTDFASDFLTTNPDINCSERLTRQESQELKQLLIPGRG